VRLFANYYVMSPISSFRLQGISYRLQSDSYRLQCLSYRLQRLSYRLQCLSYHLQYDPYRLQWHSYRLQRLSYRLQRLSYWLQFDSYRLQCLSYSWFETCEVFGDLTGLRFYNIPGLGCQASNEFIPGRYPGWERIHCFLCSSSFSRARRDR